MPATSLFFPTADPSWILLAGQNLVYMLEYILWWSASVDLEASCVCAVSADKMATLLREGCLVSVPATYFDIPGTPHEEKWSVATFGEECDSERCHGTVLKVLSGRQFARGRWDIDGRSQRVGVAELQLEAEEGGLERPAEGRRVFQPLSYSSSSDAFDGERSSSSDSDDDASESESEHRSDIQSQSASGGRKRGSSQPQRSNAKRKKSPAEVDHNNGTVTWSGVEVADHVSVDAFKDNWYKPKLRVADSLY